jgi:hypothetical protein
MRVLDTHYAVTPDGVYIAYQIMGAGPIDLVWQSTPHGRESVT